jgi:hypothetical protein
MRTILLLTPNVYIQVVDMMSVWRQRVSDAYHEGSVERCMEESGTGGVNVLMLALIENEVACPGVCVCVCVCMRV